MYIADRASPHFFFCAQSARHGHVSVRRVARSWPSTLRGPHAQWWPKVCSRTNGAAFTNERCLCVGYGCLSTSLRGVRRDLLRTLRGVQRDLPVAVHSTGILLGVSVSRCLGVSVFHFSARGTGIRLCEGYGGLSSVCCAQRVCGIRILQGQAQDILLDISPHGLNKPEAVQRLS